MTPNQKLVEAVRGFMDRNLKMRLWYMGKRDIEAKERIGQIKGVKQGPCRPSKPDFLYLNEPDGDVYIDWLDEGSDKTRSLMWLRVQRYDFVGPEEPRAVEKVEKTEAPMFVRRNRLVEGL